MASAPPFPVFSTPAPDSAPPAPPAARDPTLGEIIGAHVTTGVHDFAGMQMQSEIDAYSVVANALDKAMPAPSGIFGLKPDRYFYPARSGFPVNADRVWRDVAAARKRDPNFLKDIPASDPAGFRKWVQQQETERQQKARAVQARQSGDVQGGVGLATDLVVGFGDPINLAGMVLTGPIGGASKTLASMMAREALTNAAIEIAELPAIADNRAYLGEDFTAGDMAKDVALAGTIGALFPVAIRGGQAGGKAVGKAIGAGVDQLAPGYRLAKALGKADPAQVTDAEILSFYEGKVPPERRTPDMEAAANVLRRQAEAAASQPFVNTVTGMEAHADGINAAIAKVEAALAMDVDVAPKSASVAPAPVSVATELSRDGIIRFVINDLEGGAAVVHYGDADGGTTKYGIAAAANPGVDVANLTEAQASAIARKKYWWPELDQVDPKLAAVAFDAGYISGPDVGKRILRESGGDVEKALQLYRDHLNHLADTVKGKAKYRRGWNNRIDKLARRLAGVEDSLPVLDPANFESADAWRVAQDALDSERLAIEGHARDSDRVATAEFVDRYIAGEGRDAPDLPSFVEANRPAIAAEFARRGAELPPELKPVSREPIELPPEVIEATRAYIRGKGSLQPAALAKALGTDEATAAAALGRVASRPNSGLVTRGDRIVRQRVIANPTLLDFVAMKGGIRNDEGHDLLNTRIKKMSAGGRVITRGGMSLDRMRELAAEAGYFPDMTPEEAMGNTTTADFKLLLERDRVHAMEGLNDAADKAMRAAHDEETRAAIARVDEAIAKAGYALNLTDEEKLAIAGAAQELDSFDEAVFIAMRDALAITDDEAARLRPDDQYGTPELDELGREIRDARNAEADGERGADREGSDPAGDAAGRGGAQPEEPAGAAGGAAEDELIGHNGGPPLDDNPESIARQAEAFDDPAGPAATAQSASLEHDIDMFGGATAADRRAALERAAEGRKKGAAGQKPPGSDGGLFDARAEDQAFRLTEDGPDVSAGDALRKIDEDLDAVEKAKGCMKPPGAGDA